MKQIKCYKCKGIGKIAGLSAYANGVCFRCKGKGYMMMSEQEINRINKEHDRMNKTIEEIDNQKIQPTYKIGDKIQDVCGDVFTIIKIEKDQYITDKGVRIGIHNDDYELIN